MGTVDIQIPNALAKNTNLGSPITVPIAHHWDVAFFSPADGLRRRQLMSPVDVQVPSPLAKKPDLAGSVSVPVTHNGHISRLWSQTEGRCYAGDRGRSRLPQQHPALTTHVIQGESLPAGGYRLFHIPLTGGIVKHRFIRVEESRSRAF